MNSIPIVFAFDDNYILPATVCIFSLLETADKNVRYDIFILVKDDLHEENKAKFDVFKEKYDTNIEIISVDNTFDNSYESRYISKAAYYRLLIPWILPQYDKIIYSDVDVIFNKDMLELFNYDLDNNYVAGVYALGMALSGSKYLDSINMDKSDYINSGILLMNSKLMRDSNLLDKFVEESKKEFKFHDQDVLNIVCKGRKLLVSCKYIARSTNIVNINYLNYTDSKILKFISKDDFIDYYFNACIYHYASSQKPWKDYYRDSDYMNYIWWDFYRRSPFYDENFYKKMTSLIMEKKIEYEKNLKNSIKYKSEVSLLPIMFGIFRSNKKLILYIFFIKIVFNKKDINKLAWWIPVKKWRQKFRAKFQ